MSGETILKKKDEDGETTISAKSVMIGRMPRKEGNSHKNAIIRFFDVNNPHKKGVFPQQTLEFESIEKVRLRHLNVSYYLEGNDIIINDLSEIRLVKEGPKLQVWGKQEEIEKRIEE